MTSLKTRVLHLVATEITLLLSLVTSSAHAFASKNQPAEPLSFQVAPGVDLDPQDIPPFLHDYHTQAIKLSREVFEDETLAYVRDMSYGSESRQRLDIFWKANGATNSGVARPVVVFFHGGGWDWGYKEWTAFVAQNVCAIQDAILVTPAYAIGRGTEQMWPDARNDGLQALKWIQENIAKYGGDPNRIVLAGHSAGGHLAASIGLDTVMLDSHDVNVDSIRGLFLISSPLGIRAQDFMGPFWKFPVTRPLASLLYRVLILKILRPVVGDKTNDRIQSAYDASPLATIESTEALSSVPFVHYSYGAKGDFAICRPHLRRLQQLIDEERVQGLELPVTSHFDTHFSLADPSNEWYAALQQVLK